MTDRSSIDLTTHYRSLTHAEYSDGSVCKLEKECGCVTHEGPHWLHMDLVRRQINLQRADELKAADPLMERLALGAIAEQEIARLDRKAYEMKTRGIVGLLKADKVIGEVV